VLASKSTLASQPEMVEDDRENLLEDLDAGTEEELEAVRSENELASHAVGERERKSIVRVDGENSSGALPKGNNEAKKVTWGEDQNLSFEEQVAYFWEFVLNYIHRLSTVLTSIMNKILQLMRIMTKLSHSEHGPKVVVSILITPSKKLERDAIKSSKRVHFKLLKKRETQVFQPLEPSSDIIQYWLMFSMIPRIFDIFSWGLRLSFCDMFLRENIFIWNLDIICDVFMIANVIVTLLTVVPKGTYPNQLKRADKLDQIAVLYCNHRLWWDVGPMVLYHFVSVVFLCLPQTDFHKQNANTYLWIWFAAMQPRFIVNFLELKKYFDESVINPRIVRNVKQFQAVKIIVLLMMSVHVIGCVLYFLARINKFDETTWVHAFEMEAPYYPYYTHNVTGIGGEFFLLLYKGSCKVAGLSYDPGLPNNVSEMIVTSMTYFASMFISSMILGTLLTFLVRSPPMEVAHKERMEALRLYMQKKQVPEDLHDTVMRYCEFQFNKQKQNDSSSGNDLYKNLSRSLRIEVACAYHSDMLLRCSKIGECVCMFKCVCKYVLLYARISIERVRIHVCVQYTHTNTHTKTNKRARTHTHTHTHKSHTHTRKYK
jgi:hypothetical protein